MTRLLTVAGPKAGVVYTLEPGRAVVGRSSQSAIQMLDDAVSRHHAVFVKEEGRVTLEDLGSQNGTVLNGVRISQPTPLCAEDVVVIGGSAFIFEPRLDYLPGPGPDVIVTHAGQPASSAARAVHGEEVSGEAHEAASQVLRTMAEGSSQEGPAAWLSGLLTTVAQRFGADRAFVARVQDGLHDRVRVLASFGPGPITVSRTVVREVLGGPTALVSEDVGADQVLRGGASLQLGGVHALVAAPLVQAGRVLGLVHLDRAARGAFGPADVERLLPFARVLGLVMLAQEGWAQRKTQHRAQHLIEAPQVIAVAPASLRVVAEANKAARSKAHVLITGRTGTGKEVFARLVHTAGDRAAGPFVAVNCGALPEALQESELFGHAKGAFTGADRERAGLFEAAEGGTLFLDEIAETAPSTQVKLLRVLQEGVLTRLGETRARPVDVRVIAATHRALPEQILQGNFREDLYFRLAVICLEVPDLAARAQDILPMAQHFVAEAARSAGRPVPELSPELQQALHRYGWPGNVRELHNTMERLVIMAEGTTLGLEDLPLQMWSGSDAALRAVHQGQSLAEAVARLEREMILRCMARTGGVKAATAEALGISRVTLDAKLKTHGIPWRR